MCTYFINLSFNAAHGFAHLARIVIDAAQAAKTAGKFRIECGTVPRPFLSAMPALQSAVTAQFSPLHITYGPGYVGLIPLATLIRER